MTHGRGDWRRDEDAIGGAAGRVWLCAQRSPAAQRRGRLVAESLAHPARMLPDLAAHAIAAYSRPGEVVLDPMCGIGTTLVEAVRAGRRAVGIELEPRWVRLAEENLALARAEGHHADGRVVRGDSRGLHHLFATPSDLLSAGLARELSAELGAPSLVLTSPPYGSGVHGRITNRGPGDPIVKYRHRYTRVRARANLAHTPTRLAVGMTAILRATARVLRPGGHVVVVARPWRERGVLVDLPGQMIACAEAAGLVLTDRAVALLARLDDTGPATGTADASGGRARLVARASFFARHNLLRARAAGAPVHLIAHEDVYVFTTPDPATPPEPGGAPVALHDTARGWLR